jgi:hypothetical protein
LALSAEERRARQREYSSRYLAKPGKLEQARERSRRNSAKYRADPANREKTREYMRAWRAKNAEKIRADQRQRYGIKDAPGDVRHGACQVCTRVRRLYLDHDHDTGLIRGWLCYGCNVFIGRNKSDAEDRAARILAYVNPEST